MRGGVDSSRAAADHSNSQVSKLIRQLAGGLDAVVRGHSRANHRDGVFVFGRKRAFDVKSDGWIVDLAKRLWILRIRLNHDATAELVDAFDLSVKINPLFPGRDRTHQRVRLSHRDS